MRADRLLALLLLLQTKGRTTAATLARELEVSVRTVYRDLQALANAGVPVLAEAGPGGGCELIPGYRSPLDALTPEEADALLVLGVPAPLRELGLAEPAASARRRVGQSAAGRRGAGAATLVHLDLPRWFHPVEPTPHLVELARAVLGSRRVAVDYAAGSSPRRSHVVEPLGLVNKAGVWYLVAGTARGERVFRVGRVEGLEVRDEPFTRPDGFDLETFWASWAEEFTASRPRIPVRVRASPTALHILPEVLGDAVRPALAAGEPPDDAGWRVVTLSFERVEAAASRLLGLGDLVEVLEPDEVRRHIAETAQRALSMYAAPDGTATVAATATPAVAAGGPPTTPTSPPPSAEPISSGAARPLAGGAAGTPIPASHASSGSRARTASSGTHGAPRIDRPTADAAET